jgi:hypothetical protein
MMRAHEPYWVLKDIQVGTPQWTRYVVQAAVCPDQRRYRRLTWAERLKYQKTK